MEYVAFDIETTGLLHDSELTSVGFHGEGIDSTIFLDGNGSHGEFTIVECSTTREVLECTREYLREYIGSSITLVGYNAETWKGGFAIPFMRSHALKEGITNVFTGISYLDLYEIIDKRWNTTVPHHNGIDSNIQEFLEWIGKEDLDELTWGEDYTSSDVVEWANKSGVSSVPTHEKNSLDIAYHVLIGNNQQDGDGSIVEATISDLQMIKELIDEVAKNTPQADMQAKTL